ncbi:eCIS core domain-containing protein [Dyadobacter bucti]|uniref:eCIS core domain-containing protein n=1 Tax=Dyadobacter bucti TaxID=2572203 RepID=UPI003F6FAF72
MGKISEIARSSSAASKSSTSFFEKNGGTAPAAPSFFAHNSEIQTKLAIGKADDALEQEAEQVADHVQAKLAVGAPDDPYELEADQMADKAVSTIPNGASVQTKKEPSQTGREREEGDYVFLKPAGIQRLGEDIDGNGSRESIVAAARSMIGKIEAKHAEGSQRVGAKHLLDIFHLAAPGVWDDSVIQTAGVKMPSWCGIFSVWAHKRAGKDIGTWQIGKGVSAFGTLQQTSSPQPGDIGYIDQPYQHHCIIVKVDGNNVHSIDGNSGLYSEVKENTRPLSTYTGFFTAFGSGGAVQKKSKLQRKGKGEPATAPASVEQSISASKGKGAPLPGKLQSSMGSAMGADFSDVRIHHDHSSADMSNALNAQAFTHGKDIYFNRDKYNPASKDGQHLLAHELTHTIQQGASAQRKIVQRNGNATNTQTATTTPPVPDFNETAKEFHVDKVKLPAFKNRNKEKFATPLHSLSPRPAAWNHNEVWDKFVRKDVFNKTGSWLTDKKKTKHGDEDIYFLKSKNSDFRLFGNLVTIQEAAINPKWSRFGNPTIHQVDHIVEVQLGGDNTENNFELMDAYANINSGSAIMRERFRRMDAARDALTTKYPNIPSRQTLNSKYITHFHQIDGWDLPHTGSDKGGIYWKISEIKNVSHLEQLRSMTDQEIKASQGEVGKEYVLYMRKDGGTPIKIKLPFKSKKDWLPGIDLTGFDDQQKSITFKINTRLTKSLRQDREFTVPFTSLPFLTNAGYLNFNTTTDKGLEGFLQFNGLSPIVITEFSLHETKGFTLTGNIITNIPIIDKTPISFSLIGDDFTVSKELELGDFKDKFPKPFVVNDVSLVIFASTQKGLGVEGNMNFELTKIGKGQLKGIASSGKGFGIEGSFEFDPALFTSKIKASYIDKEFKFDGSVTLQKEKIPGVQSLTINAKYADEKVGGDGKAKLNIPGVKEIGIKVEQQDNGGILIAGDIEFGSKLKSDAKVQAVFEKGEAGWDVSIKGTLNPNVNIGGLKITEVKAGFAKGIFDVSAKVHFEKGKIKGDFDLGVTNGVLDAEGKKTEGIGKELAFYASGEVTLDIVKGVDGKLLVKITKDGDIIIGGKVEVKEDKSIVDGKSANIKTDPSLKIFSFGQKIPVASCGVASVVLELKAGVGLFYEFKGLTLDKGTNVTLEPVSLNDLSKAKVSSDISLSTGVKAGVDAFIEASAGLEVLIAGIKGKGRVNLKLTALDATAKAKVGAGFSADKGLEFKTAEMEFDVKSKIGYDVEVGVEVYLNLLVTDVTLWEHTWKPDDLKGEYSFSWFDGALLVPLKFGENNSLKPDDVGAGLKGKIDEHAKDEETYKSGVDSGINGKGPDPNAENAKTEKRIKDGLAAAYRGAHINEVFAFNSTMSPDYFTKRIQGWKVVNEHKTLKPELKELLKKEIIQYEREEYNAFLKWLQIDTTFNPSEKQLIISDFMTYRPTLGPGDRAELDATANGTGGSSSPAVNSSSVNSTPAPSSSDPLVLKKEIPGEHGYAVPDDFADKMEAAKGHGLPLPIEIRAEMGRQFGADFSQVKVHYDNEAVALASEVNAQAFTHENHIFFNHGKYDPGSQEGRKLLAHELTHVLQQGHGKPVKRVAEQDPTGTTYTGNYIFNPGHDGLSSGFFNMVKRFVSRGTLSDTEIRQLRKDAIRRNGSVLHAELLLMAAMRNAVNVALMQAHRGGSLILSMRNILEADKAYVINFDRAGLPPELADPVSRLASALFGLSGETLTEAVEAMNRTAQDRIREIGGKQFSEQAERLIIHASFSSPVIPLPEVLTAMVNAAADSTPGDQIMAGIVYVVARKSGHSTAPHILSGKLKVDALIPSVYRRLNKTGDATYNYSTDEDISKANTIYLPTNIDIFELGIRALIIHELTHAEDDLSRSTEQLVDSLDLETGAYAAQGRYFMDEIIRAAPAPGYVTAASGHVNQGPLFYWSTLLAAKRDTAKYEATFLNICTSAPASKSQAAVSADLSSGEAAIIAKIRAALLAYQSPGGQPLYREGNTRLGGGSGHYFL